ncbi:hypothetical protein HUG17_8944 [Dermatophagoides farinae]|uniref:Uncharacterized protein n=1 Tax=Dermatophagoides farinae TaxID=6954 RepID=A0A9D4SE97_DERFA|nr:hypothetical protein HUG17_8944 [Dermatophagoides farinae]
MNRNHIDVLINGQSTINWLCKQWINNNILVVQIPDKFFDYRSRNSFPLNMAIILNGQHILGSQMIHYGNQIRTTSTRMSDAEMATIKIKSLKPNELLCHTFGVDSIDQVDHYLSSLFDVAIRNSTTSTSNTQWPTWFHFCAVYGLEKLCLKLLKKSTQQQQLNQALLIRNCSGLTPIDLAHQYEHRKIVEMFNEIMNRIEQKSLSNTNLMFLNSGNELMAKQCSDDDDNGNNNGNNQFQQQTFSMVDGNEQNEKVTAITNKNDFIDQNFHHHHQRIDDDPIKSTVNCLSFNYGTVSEMDKKQFIESNVKGNEISSSSSSFTLQQSIIEQENEIENISKQYNHQFKLDRFDHHHHYNHNVGHYKKLMANPIKSGTYTIDVMPKSNNEIMIEKTTNLNPYDHIKNKLEIANDQTTKMPQRQQKCSNQFEIIDNNNNKNNNNNRNEKIMSSKYELLLLIEQFKQGISIEMFGQLFNEWEKKYLDVLEGQMTNEFLYSFNEIKKLCTNIDYDDGDGDVDVDVDDDDVDNVDGDDQIQFEIDAKKKEYINYNHWKNYNHHHHHQTPIEMEMDNKSFRQRSLSGQMNSNIKMITAISSNIQIDLV